MTPEIVIAGNLLVDDVVLADGTTRMGVAGGALLHAALAASAWGAPVGCVSVVGSDYPAEALALLRARGVALDGVRALATPGVRVWLLHEGGARRMLCREGRPSHDEVSPTPDDVPPAWRDAPFLHLAPMPFERQRALARAYGGGARFVSLDPHLPIRDDTLAAWRPVLADVDALLMSDDELCLPGAAERPAEALAALAGGRLRYVIHKQAARGGAVYDARTQRLLRWAPARAAVVDPTGAGDAFAAGLLCALRAGAPIERAIAWGAATAAAAIEGDGVSGLASSTRADLEARAAACVTGRGDDPREPAAPSAPSPTRRGPKPLVGRRRELALVVGALRDDPGAVVTLHGPAGVGKTTLAEAARAELTAAGAFPGGQWRVSFASVTRAVELHARASLSSARGPLEAWLARCGRALVTLEECEGAAEQVAEALARWRAHAPDVAWLVTSRRPLGLRDERVIPLAGLPPDDAAELLCGLCLRARPGLHLGPDDRATLAEVAASLDGSPLALELAAARLTTLTPAELRAHLAARTLTLAGGADLPARHRSLRAAVASSLDALPADARGALGALSALRGPFDLAAARSLTGRGDAEARELLVRLVTHSLAERGPDGRYRLFGAVRELAAEALGDAARRAVEAAHCAHFAARARSLAREVQSGDAATAVAELRGMLGDLFGALQAPTTPAMRVALVAGVDAARMPTGGDDALDALLEQTLAETAGDPSARVRTLALCARGRFLRGMAREAWGYVSEALAVGGAEAAARWEAQIIGSATLRDLLRHDEALALAREVFDGARAAGDGAVALRARQQTACAMVLLGDLEAARREILDTLAEAQATGQRRIEALCLANLGAAALHAGTPAVAAARLAQGAAAFEAIGDTLMLGKVDALLTQAMLGLGDVAGAMARATLAASRARAVRDRRTEVEMTLLRGRCLRRMGRETEALIALEDGAVAARALGLDDLLTEPTPAPSRRLRVSNGAYAFALDDGDAVDLSRRPNLRRMLAFLVERRAARGDAPATAMELFAAAWPGDRAHPDAATERVYTAVRTLRAMGLREVLVRRDGGYALDPATALLEVNER